MAPGGQGCPTVEELSPRHAKRTHHRFSFWRIRVQQHTTVRVEAEVPRELADRFRRVARDADRSMRAHLRVLIREAVEKSEAAPAQGGSAKTADAGGRHVPV